MEKEKLQNLLFGKCAEEHCGNDAECLVGTADSFNGSDTYCKYHAAMKLMMQMDVGDYRNIGTDCGFGKELVPTGGPSLGWVSCDNATKYMASVCGIGKCILELDESSSYRLIFRLDMEHGQRIKDVREAKKTFVKGVRTILLNVLKQMPVEEV